MLSANVRNISFLFYLLFLASCVSQKVEEPVFVAPSCYPEFPGGEKEFHKFISDNITYPSEKLKNGRQTLITGSCLIGKDGSVKNVSTAGYYKNEFDDEVKRVLRSMPEFTVCEGEFSSIERLYVVPVDFSISRDEVEETEAFVALEVKPNFPGGEKEFYEYLKKNINYSVFNRLKKREGEVKILFKLDKSGRLKDCWISKGFFSTCDSVALEAVRKMPHWIPGSARGVSPNLLYELTIAFDTKWRFIYPSVRATPQLDCVLLPRIDENIIPRDFWNDIFERKDKIKILETVNIVGYKDNK